jgi:hypothetical protein
MLITFNNPLKAFFSNKKNSVTILTLTAQIVNIIFLIETQFFIGFLNSIGVQNQFHITFGTADIKG